MVLSALMLLAFIAYCVWFFVSIEVEKARYNQEQQDYWDYW